LQIFPTSLSHSAMLLLLFPLEFRGELNHEETTVMAPVMTAWSEHESYVILTQCQCVRINSRQWHGNRYRRNPAVTAVITAITGAKLVKSVVLPQ